MGSRVTLSLEKPYSRPFQARVKGPRRRRPAPASLSPKYAVLTPTRHNRSLRWALEQLEAVGDVRRSYLASMRQVLSAVVDDNSAYATISSDGEGGLIAQWRAGRSYLAVEIGDDGWSVTQADSNGRLVLNEAGASSVPLRAARGALLRFTRDLTAVNPDWRSNF